MKLIMNFENQETAVYENLSGNIVIYECGNYNQLDSRYVTNLKDYEKTYGVLDITDEEKKELDMLLSQKHEEWLNNEN